MCRLTTSRARQGLRAPRDRPIRPKSDLLHSGAAFSTTSSVMGFLPPSGPVDTPTIPFFRSRVVTAVRPCCGDPVAGARAHTLEPVDRVSDNHDAARDDQRGRRDGRHRHQVVGAEIAPTVTSGESGLHNLQAQRSGVKLTFVARTWYEFRCEHARAEERAAQYKTRRQGERREVTGEQGAMATIPVIARCQGRSRRSSKR